MELGSKSPKTPEGMPSDIRAKIENLCIAGDMSGRDLSLLQFVLRNFDDPNLLEKVKNPIPENSGIESIRSQTKNKVY